MQSSEEDSRAPVAVSASDRELLLAQQSEAAALGGTSSESGWVEDTAVALKRERWGWYLYEAAQQVYPTSVLMSFLPPFLNKVATACQDPITKSVYLGTIPIAPSSLASYCVSISVFFQVFVFLGFGAMADFGPQRKKLLVIFSVLCSTSTGAIVFTTSEGCLWWLGGLLLIFSNVCYGAAIVFFNAFLPVLVRHHPKMMETLQENDIQHPDLVQRAHNLRSVQAIKTSIEHDMSSLGYICGYGGSLIMLFINLAVFFAFSVNNIDELWAYRANIFLAACWFFFFSFMCFAMIRPRPGPPLPPRTNPLSFSFRRIGSTLKKMPQLKDAFLFLLSFFIYSDGFSTISYVSAQFADEELKFTALEIALLLVSTMISGTLGALLFLWLNKKGLSGKTIIFINMVVIGALPVYGFLALTTKLELFIVSIPYGLQIGSIQAFSRSTFAELIPKGYESEFYSFYAITDRGTSWLGPLVFAVVNQMTGSFRLAFLCISLFFALGAPFLMAVNVPRGRDAAKKFLLAQATGGGDSESALLAMNVSEVELLELPNGSGATDEESSDDDESSERRV